MAEQTRIGECTATDVDSRCVAGIARRNKRISLCCQCTAFDVHDTIAIFGSYIDCRTFHIAGTVAPISGIACTLTGDQGCAFNIQCTAVDAYTTAYTIHLTATNGGCAGLRQVHCIIGSRNQLTAFNPDYTILRFVLTIT